MTLNFMYRCCGDGPMFSNHDEAEEWLDNNIAGGTTWIDSMVWCSDCQDWVEENRRENCPHCGAKWYDDGGDSDVCGFKGGIGRAKWTELQERKQRDRKMLEAWNKWAQR
jgi:hypothetical protein